MFTIHYTIYFSDDLKAKLKGLSKDEIINYLKSIILKKQLESKLGTNFKSEKKIKI